MIHRNIFNMNEITLNYFVVVVLVNVMLYNNLKQKSSLMSNTGFG